MASHLAAQDYLARLQGAAGLPGFPPGAESLLPPYPASLLNPPSLSSHKSSKCKYRKFTLLLPSPCALFFPQFFFLWTTAINWSTQDRSNASASASSKNWRVVTFFPPRISAEFLITAMRKVWLTFCSLQPKAKSSKSHKMPASSSSSTAPSMTSSSLPVSTQAPVTSSHHSTSASSTPNSQTNVVRWESAKLVKSMGFFSSSRFHYFF